MAIKNLLRMSLGAVAGIVLVIVLTIIFTQPYSYQGSLIDPPTPATEFSLAASDGSIFRLQEQRGDAVLLFFGYTHCPDVCPTTLYDYKQIKEQLGEKAEDVQFVFVTVDPERDTLDLLREYVSTFDEEFVALGGEADALEPVWEAYGVYHQKKEVGSAAGYLIDHTARIYVIDPEGNLRLTFPFGMAPEAMADDIAHLLKENE